MLVFISCVHSVLTKRLPNARIMRIYIKHKADTDYRFDFGFGEDLEKLEMTENTLRVILKDGQDTAFKSPKWEWKLVAE